MSRVVKKAHYRFQKYVNDQNQSTGPPFWVKATRNKLFLPNEVTQPDDRMVTQEMYKYESEARKTSC